jgi:hypothetical protein
VLLDKYLPKYDFTEVHTVKIRATPEAAYKAMMEVTLPEMTGIVKFLFDLRAIPEKIVGRKRKALGFDKDKPVINQMLGNGFVKIEEKEPQEIVFGLIVPGAIGRVWKKSSGQNVIPKNADEFFAFKDPDYLWVVANFMVEEFSNPGTVILSTESRTMALSRQAHKSFAGYWFMIRPWSGLIRRLMLRGAKRRAERIEMPSQI